MIPIRLVFLRCIMALLGTALPAQEAAADGGDVAILLGLQPQVPWTL